MVARLGRHAGARPARHPALGQRQGPDLPAHDGDRRELHVHRHPGGREHRPAPKCALAPYGIVARHGQPADLQNFFVLHEGVVGRTDGKLQEIKYKDMMELPVVEREGAQAEVIEATTDGWIGFTDKYWMTTLIPEQGKPFTSVAKYVPAADIFQVETRQPVMTVAPGATATSTIAPVRRREGMGNDPRLPERGRHRRLHRLDRLGLVLFPDQADLRRAALAARPDRQHGPCDHRADLRAEVPRAAAGLQVLRLDGADEGTAARDGGAEGTRGRRQAEAAEAR